MRISIGKIDRDSVVLLVYIPGKQLWSCQESQLTKPHYFWTGLVILSE